MMHAANRLLSKDGYSASPAVSKTQPDVADFEADHGWWVWDPSQRTARASKTPAVPKIDVLLFLEDPCMQASNMAVVSLKYH